MSKKALGSLAIFVSGLALGALSGALLMWYWESRMPEFVLTKEVDAAASYPGPEAPLRAVLGPGSKFRLTMRKGDVNHVEFDTILLDRFLSDNAKPVAGRDPAPWDQQPDSAE